MYGQSHLYDPGEERRAEERRSEERKLKRSRIDNDLFLIALEKTIEDAKQLNYSQDGFTLLQNLLNNYIDLKPESK